MNKVNNLLKCVKGIADKLEETVEFMKVETNRFDTLMLEIDIEDEVTNDDVDILFELNNKINVLLDEFDKII